MKNFCLIFIISFFSLVTNAQNQQDILFNAQIQGLLIDAPHNFEHFKGLVIEETDSATLYTSKMTLPGTTKNEITINNKGGFYVAIIATAVDEKTAADLEKTWREKIINVTDKNYEEVAVDETLDKTAQKGFCLITNNYSTGLLRIKKEGETSFSMQLVIIHLN